MLTKEEKLQKYQLEKERKEQIEHRDVLLAIASILKSNEGQTIFKYLFKNFEVAQTPPIEMQGNILHETLGFLRAGNSIYKLTCEADFEISALLLSKLERERYEQIRTEYDITTSDE